MKGRKVKNVVHLFITEYFPGFGKCIFQRSLSVRPMIFLSAPTMLESTGDSIKFRFFTITLVTCLENKVLIQRFHQWSPNSEFLQLWKKKIESNSAAARCSIKKLFLLLISFLEKTLIFLTKYFCTVLITLRLL